MHHKENIASHLRNVITALAKLCADYENIFLLGDFNFEIKEKNISDCMSTYNLKSLVKQKTSFKNPDNPSNSIFRSQNRKYKTIGTIEISEMMNLEQNLTMRY